MPWQGGERIGRNVCYVLAAKRCFMGRSAGVRMLKDQENEPAETAPDRLRITNEYLMTLYDPIYTRSNVYTGESTPFPHFATYITTKEKALDGDTFEDGVFLRRIRRCFSVE